MFFLQKRFTVPRFASKEDSRRRSVPVYCASNEESEMVRSSFRVLHESGDLATTWYVLSVQLYLPFIDRGLDTGVSLIFCAGGQWHF